MLPHLCLPFLTSSVARNQSTKVLSLANWRQPVIGSVNVGPYRADSKLVRYLHSKSRFLLLYWDAQPLLVTVYRRIQQVCCLLVDVLTLGD